MFGASIFLASSFLTSCGVLDGLGKKQQSPQSRQPEKEQQSVSNDGNSAGHFSPGRRLRRLALDVLGSLPPQGDQAALENGDVSFDDLVDAYSQSSGASQSLANLHRDMWRLDLKKLRPLDNFISSGDQQLAGRLTPAVRTAIKLEPISFIRYQLDQRIGFSEWFTSSYSVMHEELLDFYDVHGAAAPWPGEPYQLVEHSSERPAVGLLGLGGFNAVESESELGIPRRRTARILKLLTCGSMEARIAHTFYDLTEAELETDPTILMTKKTACGSCHLPIDRTAIQSRDLYKGETFDAWTTYVPGDQTTTFVAGKNVTGIEEAAIAIGQDTRVARCETTRLAAELWQRPIEATDAAAITKSVDSLLTSGNLIEAQSQLLRHQDYNLGPITAQASLPVALSSSGLRFLNRRHWQSLWQELLPGQAFDHLSTDLNPGLRELVDYQSKRPTGLYFAAVDQIARHLADSIVARELETPIASDQRTVLVDLPTSHLSSDEWISGDTNQIKTQIGSLWRRLVSTEDADEELIALFELFNSVKGDDPSKEAYFKAWRVTLTGLLTNPLFLTY